MHDEDADALRRELRTAWHHFVDLLAPLRPVLHGYCRRLTGCVWDAEDLVQETLLRAFGQWGVSHGEVRNPRAYLLRTATNVWIDTLRRRETEARVLREAGAAADGVASPPQPASDLRAAAGHLVERLTPQERAAWVLKEAFEMTLEEIADLLATTPGAVKAALHRGRGRLREPVAPAAARRPPASPELLDRFLALVESRDVAGLAALMLHGGSTENAGNSYHVGSEGPDGVQGFLRAVVYGHAEWPARFRPVASRLVRAELDGEPIVLGLFTWPGRAEALTSVFRFEEREGRIARIRSYAFCPETIRAVGAALGLPVVTGLYRAPTPAAGAEWPAPA